MDSTHVFIFFLFHVYAYFDRLAKLLAVLLAEMPQADELVGEELEVVEGDDAVFVDVDDAVEGADFSPPEVGFALENLKGSSLRVSMEHA